VHEIEALILLLISAVLLVGTAIVDALRQNRKTTERATLRCEGESPLRARQAVEMFRRLPSLHYDQPTNGYSVRVAADSSASPKRTKMSVPCVSE
jgi:hypothetical protein